MSPQMQHRLYPAGSISEAPQQSRTIPKMATCWTVPPLSLWTYPGLREQPWDQIQELDRETTTDEERGRERETEREKEREPFYRGSWEQSPAVAAEMQSVLCRVHRTQQPQPAWGQRELLSYPGCKLGGLLVSLVFRLTGPSHLTENSMLVRLPVNTADPRASSTRAGPGWAGPGWAACKWLMKAARPRM